MSSRSKSKTKIKPKSAETLDVRSTGNIKVPPLDILMFKILSLKLSDNDPPYYAVKVIFMEQLIISAIIKPQGIKDRTDKEHILAKGMMTYDPSDYGKMSLFANTPLVVHIQPLKNVMTDWMDAPSASPVSPASGSVKGGKGSGSQKTQSAPHTQRTEKNLSSMKDISCCNIDILPLFLDTDKMCIKKRMQPMISTKVMYKKSWDNLPLLSMGISAIRNIENAKHHKILEDANWMKVSVIGAYNMIIPFEQQCLYTAASKVPMYNEMSTLMVTYSNGLKCPRKFNSLSFYPRWESLRIAEERFTKSDDKLSYNIQDIGNPDDINLHYYLNQSHDSTIWGSFHRTLVIGDSARWLFKHLRQWKWPLEVHLFSENFGGYSFMGFMDLFPLLYPGVSNILLAVPLHWHNPRLMMEKCNCAVLIIPNERLTNIGALSTPKNPKTGVDSIPSVSTDTAFQRATGSDDYSAFVLVEVKLSRPLVQEVMPPFIRASEMKDMLTAMEGGTQKRECTGRGQLSREWQNTVNVASNALRRVPYHGLTEFCNFNRQLSETRTRVEIITSFWMDAAVYVNNNFVVQQYLKTDEQFEELLMMSHVSLLKIASDTLIGPDDLSFSPILRSARHARQLNDLGHALELYLQLVVMRPFDGDNWRELSTCLKDFDWRWATVCINKALHLDHRHVLTLLSKACMIYDKDKDAAEPFFDAILVWYPFWPTGYVIANAYYNSREYFKLAEELMRSMRQVQEERLTQDLPFSRNWERELGDFWESTLLLPGMSPYYDAADVLLRIRAIGLAEVCLGLALAESGESAAYYHLVGLCCRLRDDTENALCLVRKAITNYGQNTYLLCLEAECLHHSGDLEGAVATLEKTGGGTSAYSTMLSLPCWDPARVRSVLVDLIRRQPSSYAWMALANDWLLRANIQDSSDAQLTEDQIAARTCANACAVQALKWDRRAGRAWATLAKLVTPSKRRAFCASMAIECGFVWIDDDIQELKQKSQESVCHRFGIALRECRCIMCEPIKF